jgi:hypothetical protein
MGTWGDGSMPEAVVGEGAWWRGHVAHAWVPARLEGHTAE